MADLFAQYLEWFSNLFTLEALLQGFTLVVALILGSIFKRFFYSRLDNFQTRIEKWSLTSLLAWLLHIPSLLKSIILPVLVLVFVNVGIQILGSLESETTLLLWIIPLLGLWIVYRLLKTIINQRFKPEEAKLRWRQIVRPLMTLIAVLIILGLLDDFLDISVQPSDELTISLRSVLTGSAIFYLFWVLSEQVRKLLSLFLERFNLEKSPIIVISNLVSYAIAISGLFIGIATIGIDLTLLTVLLGGLSVGIGFGLQAVINNWISGFILLFERTIKLGDVIEVNNKVTKVVKIGLRTITVRTGANVELIVPNGKLLEDIIVNYTHTEQEIEVPVDVGVPYSVDLHQVFGLMMQAAEEHDDVIYGLLRLQNFKEGLFVVRLMAYIPDPFKIFKIQHELRIRIWELLRENNIPLAHPERNLHLHMEEAIPVYTISSEGKEK